MNYSVLSLCPTWRVPSRSQFTEGIFNNMNLTTIKDWSTSSINSELKLPTVYKRASLSDTSVLQLQTVYSLLYPNIQLNDCLNITYQKYSSSVYRGTHFNSYKRPIVYAREKTIKAGAVILEYFFCIHCITTVKFNNIYSQQLPG